MSKESEIFDAPPDKLWVCMHCGKTSENRFGYAGKRSEGWNATCTLNAKLFFRSLLKLREDGSVEEIIEPQPAKKKKEAVAPKIRKVAK